MKFAAELVFTLATLASQAAAKTLEPTKAPKSSKKSKSDVIQEMIDKVDMLHMRVMELEACSSYDSGNQKCTYGNDGDVDIRSFDGGDITISTDGPGDITISPHDDVVYVKLYYGSNLNIASALTYASDNNLDCILAPIVDDATYAAFVGAMYADLDLTNTGSSNINYQCWSGLDGSAASGTPPRAGWVNEDGTTMPESASYWFAGEPSPASDDLARFLVRVQPGSVVQDGLAGTGGGSFPCGIYKCYVNHTP